MRNAVLRRPALIAAVAALTLLTSLLLSRPAHAQFLPAVLYGNGLQAGQTVEAFIDGKLCASTTTNDAGEWLMQIPVDAPCAPQSGASITFVLDGQPATSDPPATWESGGIPSANIRTGYSLSTEGTPAAGTAVGSPTQGAGTPGAGTVTTTGTASPGEDTAEDDGGGSNAALFIGIGVVLVAAAAGGGFYLYRRNAA